jgi:hypothetical protein
VVKPRSARRSSAVGHGARVYLSCSNHRAYVVEKGIHVLWVLVCGVMKNSSRVCL